MQFIHWLLRATHDQKRIEDSATSSPTNQKEGYINDQKADQSRRNIIVFKHNDVAEVDHHRGKTGAKRGKVSCKKYLKVFLLCRKDIATSCFHSTINLKSPSTGDHINTRAHQYWINSMKMKKEDIMAKALVIGNNKIDQQAGNGTTTTPHGGNKVLPISETASTLSNAGANDEAASEKKERSKGEKGKTMSRMKELLRWAAAAKSEKGGKFISRKVLQFRNRASLKAVADDDQFSYESPKISFRWDVESCSTTSSVYSAISVASLKNNIPNLSTLSLSSATNCIQDCDYNNPARKGNWITTDSEFVVLEL